MRKPRHDSAADRDHLPTRFVGGAEVVLLGFPLDNIKEETRQLFIARPGAQRLHNVELQITAETRPQFPITGQAQLVAALAEVKVRHRADETDALLPAGNLVVTRRAVRAKLRLGNQRAVAFFELTLRGAN